MRESCGGVKGGAADVLQVGSPGGNYGTMDCESSQRAVANEQPI